MRPWRGRPECPTTSDEIIAELLKEATGVMVEVRADQKLPRVRCTRDDVAAWMLNAATTSTFDRQAVTIC